MQTLFPNVFWVSVTGSICAGKSTLISALKNEYKMGNLPENTIFFSEPHDIPQSQSFAYKEGYFNPKLNEAGEPEDPTAPLGFQLAVLQDYYNLVEQASQTHAPAPVLVITERSHIDAGVFWKQLFGDASNREHTSLIQTREDIFRGRTPDLTVNLLVDVDTAIQRANKRISEAPQKEGETKKFLDPKTFRFLCAEYAKFYGEGIKGISADTMQTDKILYILNLINNHFQKFVSNYAPIQS